jgi:hypothetical protein
MEYDSETAVAQTSQNSTNLHHKTVETLSIVTVCHTESLIDLHAYPL